MKKLALIPSLLLTPQDVTNLKLQNQAFMLIIPKKLVEKVISDSDLSFDLVIDNGRLLLVGPPVTPATTQTVLPHG